MGRQELQELCVGGDGEELEYDRKEEWRGKRPMVLPNPSLIGRCILLCSLFIKIQQGNRWGITEPKKLASDPHVFPWIQRFLSHKEDAYLKLGIFQVDRELMTSTMMLENFIGEDHL